MSNEQPALTYTPIGVIHSPFTRLDNMPIQPAGAAGVQGTVEVYAPYRAGLLHLDGFSHIILLYALHRSTSYTLLVEPFLDTQQHGVFATRAPRRPNPIGLSVVQLDAVSVEEGILSIRYGDILDGTPLLDIKPFVPDFDAYQHAGAVRTGWLEAARKGVAGHTSDNRFVEGERGE